MPANGTAKFLEPVYLEVDFALLVKYFAQHSSQADRDSASLALNFHGGSSTKTINPTLQN